ncbi:glucuronate isomerase [Alloacidobacterium sp.]|uniref:glucuronate isomerase n=1 Tax=Alloacidobacterium sp. TaxID=2951999 RepID=UPI002D3643B4|nr:glucuronate isomerase [Alloacidobacterium sp.]HYK35426.1 glucuronate isomerase [Alloacidobacterium sp.]
MAILHPDRLFPADPETRGIARRLYATISDLPIISPHGHTEAAWFAKNESFPDPAQLLILPDHYVYRMLYSQGVSMRDLGIGQTGKIDSRKIWRIFAKHYHLFRGTPTRLWLDYEFEMLFGLDQRLSAATADHYFDVIAEKLQQPEFLPRALYERFRLEALSTTDSPLDSLEHHRALRESGWKGCILPTFRPDSVVDPTFHGFRENISQLGEQTGEDTTKWSGYLNALRKSRERFKSLGCTATDHGHPTANTANLDKQEAEKLFATVLSCKSNAEQRELFRAQMLTEMARMSIDDGLVMQLHPGSFRNHNQTIFDQCGRDAGADIPTAIDYVHGLKPLLDLFGNEPSFTFILFTLDESTFSRELAPLAGHYPCLRLGPPWWFLDSPEGMMRFRELATETAGFYNTVGFNDDTRAFLSIPARHDVARRIDCAYLARLVAEHRLDEDEAFELAQDLTINLVRKAYRL